MIVQEASAASLSIDGDAMEVKENDDMNLEDKWAPLREFGVFAILAVVLVAFAVVFLLCFVCICRRSGRRSAHHKTYPKSPFLMSGSHYPYTSYPGVAATFGPSSKDTVLTKASSNASSSAGSGNTPNAKRANGGGTLKSGNGATECPRGIGETTYQEWFAKVASKETPSHYQENAASAIYGTPVTRQPRGGLAAVSSVTSHQSYVTYPNEPSAYYTLSGEHRIHHHGASVGDYGGVGGAAAAPPSYYHHQQRHF